MYEVCSAIEDILLGTGFDARISMQGTKVLLSFLNKIFFGKSEVIVVTFYLKAEFR